MPVKWFPKKLNAAVKQQAKDAVLRTAFAIEADAKRLTPVDTGALRSSISVNWSDSGMTRGKVDSPAKSEDGVGQPKAEGKDEVVAAIGTNKRYAGYQEFGTYKMSPHPFLRPAFEKNKHKLDKNFRGKL